MRYFLREAYPSKASSILDTVAFTIFANHREAIYHIHFYSEEENIFYMACIGTFSTLRGLDPTIERCKIEHSGALPRYSATEDHNRPWGHVVLS